jgi:hypothetical protein
MTQEENEKRVRAFYEATVPGHREALRGLQAPDVVYDMPEGMPWVVVTSRAFRTCSIAFSPASIKLLTFTSSPKSSLPRARKSSRSVVSKEKLEKQPCPSMCPSPMSGQSAMGISNDCVLSPTQQC